MSMVDLRIMVGKAGKGGFSHVVRPTRQAHLRCTRCKGHACSRRDAALCSKQQQMQAGGRASS